MPAEATPVSGRWGCCRRCVGRSVSKPWPLRVGGKRARRDAGDGSRPGPARIGRASIASSKETIMRPLQTSSFRLAGFALLLAGVLAGSRARPAAAQLASIDPIVNPVVASRTWDESSGYGVVEANRAGLAALSVADPIGLAIAGASVDPRRVQTALAALQAGDLGGLQEAALETVVDEAQAWGAVNGYDPGMR